MQWAKQKIKQTGKKEVYLYYKKQKGNKTMQYEDKEKDEIVKLRERDEENARTKGIRERRGM